MFGSKAKIQKIDELERALAASEQALERANQELAQLHAAQRSLTHERDQLRAHLSHPRPRADERAGAKLDEIPVDFEPIEDPTGDQQPWAAANYRVYGPLRQLVTLDLLLRTIHCACEWGSTAWYSIMVDGDGAGSLLIERDGQAAALTQDEESWLFASEDRPACPPHLQLAEAYFQEHPQMLTFDIV
ncbi:hypothetical protein DB30_04639 [Enhygromyxa salina]|uniref:Uncharacterized protein n=1 Tax=Enhygromyxa salina TaxID=215803 RepID=A0A0C1ZNW9_9BACT|nr:hypothetical protein [Enhygromyxa salina]KIG19174.1 hypothetical protein DB30_04639 [Enhygromyxa salina]